MAEFKFYLGSPKAEKSAVVIYVRWQHNTVKYSPGISVLVEYWDNVNQRVREVNSNPFASNTNSDLSTAKAGVEKLFNKLKNQLDRLPTKAEFELALKYWKKGDSAPVEGLLSFWEKYIKLLNAQLQAAGKDMNRNSTATSYMQTLSLLREMLGQKGEKVGFQEVNEAFYIRLLNFSTHFKHHKANTTGKHVKNLKAIMEKARRKGLHSNTDHEDFKMPTEEVHSIALTKGELDAIYKLELTGKNAHLAPSRDLFIIAASTGLRFGDWSQFTGKDLSGDTVTITTEKTNATVVIPLSKRVKEILASYEFQPPQPKQNQPLNRDLKQIAKLAGIAEIERYSSIRNGVKTMIECERWELVTTHTARRSFATNLYLVFPHPYEIMKITGHKTEVKFLKYIKISKDDAALKMLEFID